MLRSNEVHITAAQRAVWCCTASERNGIALRRDLDKDMNRRLAHLASLCY